MGVRLKVRGGELTLDHAAMARDPVPDVRLCRVSAIKPYRDHSRLDDPNYVHSLPKPAEGQRYFGRDDEATKTLRTFVGLDPNEGEEDEQAEEIVPALPKGAYYAQTADDGTTHIFRRAADEGEARLQPPENNGSPPIGNDLPSRLAAQNRDNAAFWRRQLAGNRGPNSAAPNVAAIAAVMRDPGTRDSAMHQQAALREMNAVNRQHYGRTGTHDAGGQPKGPPAAASINAANKQRGAGPAGSDRNGTHEPCSLSKARTVHLIEEGGRDA